MADMSSNIWKTKIQWHHLVWAELYPPKFICWSFNPQYLSMWLFRDKVFKSGNYIIMRPLGYTLIQMSGVLKGIADLDTDMYRGKTVWVWKEAAIYKPKRLACRNQPCQHLDSGLLQNCKEITFCCVSHPSPVLCHGSPSKLL